MVLTAVNSHWLWIHEFYSELKENEKWSYVEVLGDAVQELIETRDLSSLTPFTSHHILCTSRHQTYEIQSRHPVIELTPRRDRKVDVEVVEHRWRSEEGGRRVVFSKTCEADSIVGCFDAALKVLCELDSDR